MVGNVDELITAVGATSTSRIIMEPGAYLLTAQLSIGKNIVLEAAQPGTVVLDGQGSMDKCTITDAMDKCTRILSIASAIVHLIGLHLTGGYANAVSLLPIECLPLKLAEHFLHRPDGEPGTDLLRLCAFSL